MIDYHVHTGYSHDATGTIEDYCKVAQERGIGEIAFTNHLNFGRVSKTSMISIPEQHIASIDVNRIPEYCNDIENARKKFKVKIKLGFEIDYFRQHVGMIRKILEEYPIDFVLGSCHFVEGYPVSSHFYTKTLFDKKDECEMLNIYEKYFKLLKEAVESGLFDVMAHPDIVNKFACNYLRMPFERYEKMASEVISSMVKSDVGIEINTSGYYSEIGDSSPSIEFLKICKSMGIRIITIGSDSHRPVDLGRGIDRGIEKLKSVGYDSICIFDKRRPSFVRI
jgi:histidinol-phosphatase (PHP family)